MIIIEHCRPGARENREGWLPRCAWPDDCQVQWGRQGMSFERAPGEGGMMRLVAFFEAIPADGDTFVRGEGATLEEAEDAAFASYQRYWACPGHTPEKRGYKNGAGFCSRCGLFISGAFEPEPETIEDVALDQLRIKLALARMCADPEAAAFLGAQIAERLAVQDIQLRLLLDESESEDKLPN